MTDSDQDIFLDFIFWQWAICFPSVLLLMFLFYLIYLVIKNPGLVDVGWEASHFCIGLIMFFAPMSYYSIRKIVFICLLFIWFLRLGGYIFLTRIVPGEKDPRYEKLAEAKNPYVFFLMQYELQGFLVSLTSVPLYFVFQLNELTWSFYVGVSLVVIGIIFEAIADCQLYQYKCKKKSQLNNSNDNKSSSDNRLAESKSIFQGGLWKKSRHPNLFFEQVIWFGFAIGGIQSSISIIGFIGPIILHLIMRFLTVPISEEYMRKTRPNYEEFCQQTNTFFIF